MQSGFHVNGWRWSQCSKTNLFRYYVTGQLTSDNHKSYCSLDSLQVNIQFYLMTICPIAILCVPFGILTLTQSHVSPYCRRSTCIRLTTRCQTWRPSWTRSSATRNGTFTTPAELRWAMLYYFMTPHVFGYSLISCHEWKQSCCTFGHFVPCDFVTLEQSGSRSERFESLTGKLTKIINGPVWKLYNFSRAEVRNILQGGFINKEVHAFGLVSMWFLHLGVANAMNCTFCF